MDVVITWWNFIELSNTFIFIFDMLYQIPCLHASHLYEHYVYIVVYSIDVEVGQRLLDNVSCGFHSS